MHIIDEGDGTTDVTIKFGDTLSKNLTYNVTDTAFTFDDDVTVGGNVTASGTFSGSSLVVSDVASCSQIVTDSTGAFSCGSVVSLTGGNLATIQIRRDTDFTLAATGTFYDIPFNNTDTESDPTVLEHDNTLTERIDIKQNGFYLISYHVNANDAGVTHQLDARVRANNATTIAGSLTIGRNYQNEYSPNVSTNVVFLTTNDFLTLQVSRSTANTVINETVLTVTKLNGIQGAKGEKGDSGDLTAAAANILFVSQSGDTMTGSLIISNGAGLDSEGSITTNTNIAINNNNSAADAVLTFGNDAGAESIQFNDAIEAFIVSDGLVADDLAALNNLFVNVDNTAADAILTFGNDLGTETLRFSDANNRFEFSDDLNVQGTLSGNTLIASDTANCQRIATNASGQISCGTANYYDVYDNTGGQNTAVTTTINLDTTRFANANFTLAADEVTVLSTGIYEVTFSFSANADSNSRSNTRSWLEQSNGVLFTEVDGSRCWIYNRNTSNGEGSCTRSMILTITANNKLRIRAVSTDGGAKSALADGSSLTIKRLY